jgi:hypothetical protein
MWPLAESNLKIEYLREYDFIFKTALAHESGEPGVLFAEKTEGQKSRETVPFNAKKGSVFIQYFYTFIQ